MSFQEAQIITGRNMGGIVFDVTVEEQHEDSLEITSHPVEHGAEISDHAHVKPATVTIRAGVSNCGVFGDEYRARDVYEQLLALQRAREPFAIITGKRLYENMLVETLTVVTAADTENALMVSAQCREVIIVETQTTTIPPRARHKSPAKTGGTSDKGQKQPRQSMLKAGLG